LFVGPYRPGQNSLHRYLPPEGRPAPPIPSPPKMKKLSPKPLSPPGVKRHQRLAPAKPRRKNAGPRCGPWSPWAPDNPTTQSCPPRWGWKETATHTLPEKTLRHSSLLREASRTWPAKSRRDPIDIGGGKSPSSVPVTDWRPSAPSPVPPVGMGPGPVFLAPTRLFPPAPGKAGLCSRALAGAKAVPHGGKTHIPGPRRFRRPNAREESSLENPARVCSGRARAEKPWSRRVPPIEVRRNLVKQNTRPQRGFQVGRR